MLIEASDLLKLYNNKIWQNNIIVLDASWYLPNQERNAYEEYKKSHIPHALFFDIDKVCNIESDFPHTVPTESQFINNMEELGVNNKKHIILYSHDGIGASPRAWWLFKLFGHKNISILNGGLIAWLNISGENSITIPKVLKSTYIAKINKKLLATNSDVIDSLNKNEHQIVDARSIGRFKGTEEEPRPGLQKGHIPNSINIPFNLFLNDGYFLKQEQILDILNSNNFFNMRKPFR